MMSDGSIPQPQRMTMVCRHCGSEDVLADAYAAWSNENQRWELASVMDGGHYCNQCDGEATIDEQPLDEPTLPESSIAPPTQACIEATTVYLNARTDHDYTDVPRYAVLTVTPELIEHLRVLRSQVIAQNLAEAVVWAYPEKWGGGNEDEGWRTEADQLAVSVDGFLYRCYLKHTTVLIETEFLGIDELVESLAEGKRIFGELEQEEIVVEAVAEGA